MIVYGLEEMLEGACTRSFHDVIPKAFCEKKYVFKDLVNNGNSASITELIWSRVRKETKQKTQQQLHTIFLMSHPTYLFLPTFLHPSFSNTNIRHHSAFVSGPYQLYVFVREHF